MYTENKRQLSVRFEMHTFFIAMFDKGNSSPVEVRPYMQRVHCLPSKIRPKWFYIILELFKNIFYFSINVHD